MDRTLLKVSFLKLKDWEGSNNTLGLDWGEWYAGNALARVQWVHEPADLWEIIFCTRFYLVLCAPTVLRPRSLQDAPAPADSNF